MNYKEIESVITSMAVRQDTTGKRMRPCMLWGPPGVGKTHVMRSAAERYREHVRKTHGQDAPFRTYELSLTTVDSVDLRGGLAIRRYLRDGDGHRLIGIQESLSGTSSEDVCERTTWASPEFFPIFEECPHGVLILDDLSAAVPSVQVAAYELLQFGTCGNAKLPPGWVVMAAGNGMDDRAVAYRMSSALSRRIVHIDFKVDVDLWIKWALKAEIHPSVVGFVRYRPELLHAFNPEKLFQRTDGVASSLVERTFACPATWEGLSDVLHAVGDNSPQVDELVPGVIGVTASVEFRAFLRLKGIPEAEDIFRSPDTVVLPVGNNGEYKVDVLYATVANVTARVSDKTLGAAFQFADRLGREGYEAYRTLIYRDITGRLGGTVCSRQKRYKDWVVAWTELVNS